MEGGLGVGGCFSLLGVSGTGFKKINFVEGGIQKIFVSIFVLDCWL